MKGGLTRARACGAQILGPDYPYVPYPIDLITILQRLCLEWCRFAPLSVRPPGTLNA
jgi:hypothetical protein